MSEEKKQDSYSEENAINESVPSSSKEDSMLDEIEEFDKKSQKKEKTAKIISRVITACFSLAILAFVVFLIVLIVQSSNKELDGLTITDEFKKAYAQDQNIYTHDTESYFMETKEGSVFPYSLIYIPKAGYVQICVRYNKNQIKGVIEEGNCPNFTEDDIFFTLTGSDGSTYTPVNHDGEDGFVSEASRYKYFKLEFVGVDFEKAEKLYINMIFDGLEKVTNEDKTKTYLIEKEGATFVAGNVLIHDHFEINTDEGGNEIKVEKTYAPYTLSDEEKKKLQ